MNYDKNPKLARKIAKEQAHLRKVARKNPDRLTSQELALADWDIRLDNYEEFEQKDGDTWSNEQSR